MKIVSIKFLNLNSLKGLHEIRFDRAPFTESGLFAITGPTGAGKTTLLDAITVALYGRVHRHNNDDPSEIMTRHTGESFSEVEFEVKNVVYRSKWSNYRAHKKANTRLQGVKMELSNAATNEIIESHHLAKVQNKVVEVCGLDYHQFLRSVILSQGDFTRFLKANENERSELLEKLTDTGIYSEISMFTFAKTRDEKTRLEGLQSRLNNVTLLSEEELSAYQINLSEISANEKEKVNEKNIFENQLNWVQNLGRLNIRKQQLQMQYETFIGNLELQQPLFQKLNLHTQALKHQPLLKESEAAGKQLAEVSKLLTDINLKIPALAETLELINTQTAEAGDSYHFAEHEQLQATPVLLETEKKDILITGKNDEVLKAQKELDQLNQEILNTNAIVFKQQNDLQVLKGQVNELKQWLSNNSYDGDLEKLIPVLAASVERLNDIYKKVKILEDEKNKFQHDQLAENKNSQVLQQKLEQGEPRLQLLKQELTLTEENLQNVLEGKSLEEWENEAGNLPALVSVCEQQFGIATKIREYNKHIEDLESKDRHFSQQLEQERVLFDALTHQQKEAEELFEALQKNVELQIRIQKYEADRKNLQPNEECPLCGSLHHPYIHDNVSHELNEAEEKRNAQKAKLDHLIRAVNDKDVLTRSIVDQREQVRIQKASIVDESILMVKNFDDNNAKLPKPLDKEKPEIIAAVIVKKSNELALLKEKIRQIRSIGKKIKEFESAIAQQNEEALKTDSAIKQSAGKIENLQASIARNENELAAIAVEEKDIINKTSELLQAYQIAFNYPLAEDILKQLKSRAKKFTKTQKDLQEKEIEVSKTESDVKHLEENVYEKTERLQKLSEQLTNYLAELDKLKAERFILFGEKSPGTERERLQKQVNQAKQLFEELKNKLDEKKQEFAIAKNQQTHFEGEREKLQDNYKKVVESLHGQLVLDQIESVEALQQMFLSEAEAENILQKQKQLEKEKTELEQSLKDIGDQLRVELEKDLTSETEEVITDRIREAEEIIRQLNQQIGQINEILKADNQKKEQYRELAAQIELQKKEYDRWNKLCLLIGSENGKKFSRFAQGLTLARLTELANRHLIKLSDRYRILKTAEKDLELQIIDGYQADAVRPMATLSGGESFLVSLALALGLSDLASRKVQINSLFIDEGFGTLDPETLDVAVTALENLQANGKSIGIISHVEALKDRIGTQIQVTKQPGGHSKIKVVSYAREFSY